MNILTHRTGAAALASLLLAATASFGVSTTADAQEAKRLVLGRSGDIDKLDPHQTTAHQTYQTLELVYDNLFELDENLRVQPALATGWEYSEDGTQLTIKLREGVTFHDGSSFDSEDVKASIERVLDPATSAISRNNILTISEVTTPDPQTVVLELSQPDGTLPSAFTDLNTTMLSSDDIAAGTIASKPNGTGAFKWGSWTQGQSIALDANPDYWFGAPKIAGIDQRVVGDQFSLLAGLRAQQYDFGVITSPIVAQQVTDPLVLAQASSLAYWPLMMQTTKAPFDDVRVRQAVSCAIDRNEVLNTAAFGQGSVTGPFTLPAYATDPFDGLPCDGVDRELSKKLLAEAGYPDGFSATTSIISGDDPTAQNIGQSIKSQLEEIGIELELNTMETNVYVSRWLDGDFETSISPNSGRADPHLVYTRIFAPDAPLSKSLGYSDEELTALMEQGRAETDPAKREEIYKDMARHLVGAAPMAWLFVPNQFWAMQPNVKGFVPYRNLSLRSLRSVSIEP